MGKEQSTSSKNIPITLLWQQWENKGEQSTGSEKIAINQLQQQGGKETINWQKNSNGKRKKEQSTSGKKIANQLQWEKIKRFNQLVRSSNWPIVAARLKGNNQPVAKSSN